MAVVLLTILFCLVLLIPSISLSRVNSLTTGLSFSYDYSDRSYKQEVTDNESDATQEDSSVSSDDDDDDYSKIAVTPSFHFLSKGSKDHFELQAAPKIKYDLMDYDTNWDSDLKVGASKYLLRSWQLEGSNHFLRSDYQEESIDEENDSTSEISTDPGRDRYWRNVLSLYSRYWYANRSLVEVNGEYTALRNEDGDTGSYEDYDRYRVSIKNEHSFSKAWSSRVKFSFIRGDYYPDKAIGTEDVSSEDELSEDVKEYRASASLINNTLAHNTIFINYEHIDSQYDEEDQDNETVHQGRLNWSYVWSARLNTTIGAGPTYRKTEEQEGRWGGNGVITVNYSLRDMSYDFSVEKNYDVENFSGSDERGIVDYWNVSLSYSYLLYRDFNFDARLGYRYEDREYVEPVADDVIASYDYDPGAELSWGETYYLKEYNKQSFTASIGVEYSFLETYKAGVRYTFKKQDSEQADEDYEDHRVLITITWKQKILQW